MIQKAVRREPRLVRIHDCTVNKSGSSMHLTYLYMILMCLDSNVLEGTKTNSR